MDKIIEQTPKILKYKGFQSVYNNAVKKNFEVIIFFGISLNEIRKFH